MLAKQTALPKMVPHCVNNLWLIAIQLYCFSKKEKCTSISIRGMLTSSINLFQVVIHKPLNKIQKKFLQDWQELKNMSQLYGLQWDSLQRLQIDSLQNSTLHSYLTKFGTFLLVSFCQLRYLVVVSLQYSERSNMTSQKQSKRKKNCLKK